MGSLQRSAMKFERGACKSSCACAGAHSLPRSCGSFGRWPHFMERRWHPNTVETLNDTNGGPFYCSFASWSNSLLAPASCLAKLPAQRHRCICPIEE